MYDLEFTAMGTCEPRQTLAPRAALSCEALLSTLHTIVTHMFTFLCLCIYFVHGCLWWSFMCMCQYIEVFMHICWCTCWYTYVYQCLHITVGSDFLVPFNYYGFICFSISGVTQQFYYFRNFHSVNILKLWLFLYLLTFPWLLMEISMQWWTYFPLLFPFAWDLSSLCFSSALFSIAPGLLTS